jgi:haloacetate dehalogenase
MEDTNRRELLRRAARLAAGGALGGAVWTSEAVAAPAPQGAAPARFFPGFKADRIQTSGAVINTVSAGSGPPVLLMHGAPETHISWRLVAPELAKDYTVVATDLRGYGDSSTPPDAADPNDHSTYSKRPMALDQIEVMRHFGFSRFAVVGHDRGGRVGRRMALDHPDVVTRLAVLDIVPAHYLYSHVTIDFVRAYFHWFNYLREAPGPEKELEASAAARKGRTTDEVQLEYLRTSSRPANIHAMCEDYRASASIDLKNDAADQAAGKKITCPLLVLWGERGPMGRIYDVLGIWKQYEGTNVSGRAMPSGHNVQEQAPQETLREIRTFLKG